MLLKQIIMTKSIPFEIKFPQAYTDSERINEVNATMSMEYMPLNEDDIQLLKAYQASADKERLRKQLLDELTEV